MAKKKLPGHKWKLVGEELIYFKYKCQKCPAEALNGVPLVVPYDLECG
jgi:hypothetical protein